MQFSNRLVRPTTTPGQLHPPIMVHGRLGLSSSPADVDGHLDGAQQLPAGDAASAAHAAGEDGDLESEEGLGGEATEGGGVEVEAGGGGGGVRRRGGGWVGGGERDEGGLGREAGELELGVAGSCRRVNTWTGGFSRGRRELEGQGFDDETDKWTGIHFSCNATAQICKYATQGRECFLRMWVEFCFGIVFSRVGEEEAADRELMEMSIDKYGWS